MRIVSLAPSITEILFAIDCNDMIIANTAYCDYPVEAKHIPTVGSWIYVNDEKIISFKPDLVITATIVQHNAARRYQNLHHIHLDPRSLDDIYENIQLLGTVTKHRRQAKLLVDKLKRQESKISNLKLTVRPRVYVEEWFDPPMISGNWVPDIVNIAGGDYYDGLNRGDTSRPVSINRLIEFDPEIIFVSYCGYKDKSDPQKILQRPGWQMLTAVQNKRVYPVNDDLLNRPGPRVLQAAEEMKRHLSFFSS